MAALELDRCADGGGGNIYFGKDSNEGILS